MNWVGIDGYYLRPSWKFAALFGPTHQGHASPDPLTLDPILISETAATRAHAPARQPDQER